MHTRTTVAAGFAAFAALAALASCSTAGADAPPQAIDAGAADASATQDVVELEAACESHAVPFLVEETDGTPLRLFVETRHAQQRAALLFDTGSSTTFLGVEAGAPDPAPDAGELTIGACSVHVDGRPYPSDETIGDLRVVGTLGSDVLLATPSELDLGGRRLVRYAGDAVPAEIAGWPTVRFDRVRGLILVHVTVDGKPLRLMLDTGSPHLLWLGEQGQPGDAPYRTRDAVGNELTFHLGRATLELAPGVTDAIPILRAPSFPYFEETVRILGGSVHGLLGLSALGPRRIVVDPRAGVLRVGPREPK